MRNVGRNGWIACAAWLVGVANAGQFRGLGDLPGGAFTSISGGISANGGVVAGASATASFSDAYRWTWTGGMVGLGDAPGWTNTIPNGISGDGQVIVGLANNGGAAGEAFRWTSQQGFELLGYLPGGAGHGGESHAKAASFDGRYVVGSSLINAAGDVEAFRWASQGGMVGLGHLPGAFINFSSAWGVTPDGNLAVGSAAVSNGFDAMFWTEAGGMASIGDLPGGPRLALALTVSADGQTIGGFGYTATGVEGFRWTEETGMVAIGDLPGGDIISIVADMTADGSILVGNSDTGIREAIIWDETHGLRRLQEVLENEYGLSMPGWTLNFAKGISDDGTVITGHGTNPAGNTEAWIARIPEPPSILLLAGLALSLRWRRCPPVNRTRSAVE